MNNIIKQLTENKNELDKPFPYRDTEIDLPISINIQLIINGELHSLIFTANKVDIYKNHIKTKLN